MKTRLNGNGVAVSTNGARDSTTKSRLKVPNLITPLSLAIIVGGLSVLSYLSILGYDFTGSDAIPLIMTSRVPSISALKTVLTSRLLGTYLDEAYYRPITSLSYGVDYAIWDLKPLGYHFTDLILHTLNSILVFVFVRNIAGKRGIGVALLAASVFALHPIHIETVPAIARRADLLSAFFLLLSLVFWQMSRAARTSARWSYLGASLLLCGLAMGSKDSAIVLPFLFFVYITVFYTKQDGAQTRFLGSAKQALPFLFLLIGYLALRILILGGIGGTGRQSTSLLSGLGVLLTVSLRYFEALIYPVDFLNLGSKLTPSLISNALQAYIPGFVAIGVIAILGLGFVQGARRRAAATDEHTDPHRKLQSLGPYLFFLCWLLFYLCLYVLSEQFRYWYSYTPAIALSGLISIGLSDLLADRGKAQGRFPVPAIQSALEILSIVILAGLVVSFFLFSPLLRGYAEWEAASFISSRALNATTDYVRELPDDSTLYLINFPRRILWEFRRPYVKQCSVLRDYSVETWMKLQFPDKNRLKAVSLSYLVLSDLPSEMEGSIEFSEDKVTVTVGRGGEVWLTGKGVTSQDHPIIQLLATDEGEIGRAAKLEIHLDGCEESIPNEYILLYDPSDGGRIWDLTQACSEHSSEG
jgi:hypothetical protein